MPAATVTTTNVAASMATGTPVPNAPASRPARLLGYLAAYGWDRDDGHGVERFSLKRCASPTGSTAGYVA